MTARGRRRRIAAALLWLGAAEGATAQEVQVSAFGALVANQEIGLVDEAVGVGVGGELQVSHARWRARVGGVHAWLGTTLFNPTYTAVQLEGSGMYFVRPFLALEAGLGRRFVSPEFSAQEIGWFKAGVRWETVLARIARLWASGDVLPGARFSGGGDAGLGLEVGFGTVLGSPTGTLRALAEFQFQRVGRTVGGFDVPIEFSVARLGVTLRL